MQIQKGRNNSREIFLIDYEAWVKSESNGSMKMNKVAREFWLPIVLLRRPCVRSWKHRDLMKLPWHVLEEIP